MALVGGHQSKLMDKHTKENWAKVKAALETANKTDTYFYKRAVVICKGGLDPLEEGAKII